MRYARLATTGLTHGEASSGTFSIGGPATASWREHALARAGEYRFLTRLLIQPGPSRDAIESHIDAAERAAAGEDTKLRRTRKMMSLLGGAEVERVNSQLDAVETDLLRLAKDPYLRGQLPNLVAHVRNHLKPDDPRRQQVEAVAERVRAQPQLPLSELETDEVLGSTRAASLEARREIRRVRSFRNVLLITALILALGVAGVTIMGILAPQRVAICFAPDNALIVCPTASKAVPKADQPPAGTETGSAQEQVKVEQLLRSTAGPWDIPVVEIVGLLAAALAGAFALRDIQGTSTPYSLPAAAAVLKLPTGALTAVFGLLLMRGGFVPGLSALDTSAQIIAWAIVFGYSQQLLTRFVDQQASNVLDQVDTPPHPELARPSGSQLPANGGR